MKKLKFATIPLLLATALSGCGKPDKLLNSSPLMPLVQARYKADNSVKTFVSRYEAPDPVYYQGRVLYDRASADVNALLTTVILSIEANSDITDSEYFEEQVAASLTSALNFQTFVEAKMVGGARGGLFSGFKLNDIMDKINPQTVVSDLAKSLREATNAARVADTQQRTIMICEIKSLLLPSFDAIQPKQATYPDPKCADLREKLTPETKKSENASS